MEPQYDTLPEKVKRRIDLSKMFYPLERKHERRWGNMFKSDFKVNAERFRELSIEKKYNQNEISDHMIIWQELQS